MLTIQKGHCVLHDRKQTKGIMRVNREIRWKMIARTRQKWWFYVIGHHSGFSSFLNDCFAIAVILVLLNFRNLAEFIWGCDLRV